MDLYFRIVGIRDKMRRAEKDQDGTVLDQEAVDDLVRMAGKRKLDEARKGQGLYQDLPLRKLDEQD